MPARLAPALLAALLTFPAAARADDWCKPTTVESQIRRWGTAPFAKSKDLTRTADALRTRLATELLGTLAVQVDARYQPQVLALTGRVQTLSTTQRKVSGGREVCVVVQMDKGGVIGDLPSDVGRQLLTKWQDSLVAFTAGRPVWVREVALRDRSEPEIDEIVVPRVEDLVRRNLMGVVRYEPDGGARPADLITFDVRITPYPGYYAIEGVAKDASGRALSVGAELAAAWLGAVGTRLPLSSRDLQIANFTAPAVVFTGAPAKLVWESRNARSCRMEPGIGDVPTAGKYQVLPQVDTVYRLTCTDGVRSVSRDASITLRTPPPISEMVPAQVLATVAAPVAAGPVLDIRVLDGAWLDVRVNGQVVASFHNQTEARVTLADLPAYRVEVVPFMATEATQAVTMSGLYQGHGSIGVSVDAPIDCYGTATCVP